MVHRVLLAAATVLLLVLADCRAHRTPQLSLPLNSPAPHGLVGMTFLPAAGPESKSSDPTERRRFDFEIVAGEAKVTSGGP